MLTNGAPNINLFLEEGFMYTFFIAIVSYIIGYTLAWFLQKYNYERKTFASFEALAEVIAQREGKKKAVNIAQIKEILKITLVALADLDRGQVNALFDRYGVKKI